MHLHKQNNTNIPTLGHLTLPHMVKLCHRQDPEKNKNKKNKTYLFQFKFNSIQKKCKWKCRTNCRTFYIFHNMPHQKVLFICLRPEYNTTQFLGNVSWGLSRCMLIYIYCAVIYCHIKYINIIQHSEWFLLFFFNFCAAINHYLTHFSVGHSHTHQHTHMKIQKRKRRNSFNFN